MDRSAAVNRISPAPTVGPTQAPVSLASVKTLLSGLNREQRRAVTHREGPQLVIAGPGTGKTEVVTRRVAWLIETKRVRPREILALTFTDAAAEEMQARVDELVPYGQADAGIHTFHALGDRLLREHAFELGLPGDVRLISRAEAVLLLREHLFELGLERYLPLGDPTRFLAALVDLFLRAKDECIAPAAFLAHADELATRAAAEGQDAALLADLAASRREVANAYGAYQQLLAQRGLIDHGDQIALALRLLRERPAIRQSVAGRYQYILVDEFQDTNPAQLQLVFELTGREGNITVVGDPDQAIYTFRGAAVSNIRRFVGAHPDLRCVVLRRNYRSQATVVAASRRLIEHNGTARLSFQQAAEVAPVAHRRARSPLPVRELSFATPEDEADGVAAHIAARVAAGERPSSFAVLVRTNGDAEALLASLRAHGVPARGSANGRLLDEPVVRSLLAYLRVMANPDDSLELYLLAAAQPYELSQPDLALLMQVARRRQRSLWQVLEEAPDAAGLRLSEGGRRSVARLVEHVQRGLRSAASRTSAEVLYDHLRHSGRLAQLAAADRAGNDAITLHSVARFFQIVRSRAGLLAEDRVSLLVPHLAALEESGVSFRDAGPLDEDVVSVLTVHRAKGLEFEKVYLGGLVDGRFPGHGRPPLLTLPTELLALRDSADDEDSLAEERRLAYVAMTRARDELWLTHHTSGPGGRGRRRPSPFIAEALNAPAVPAEVVPATAQIKPPTDQLPRPVAMAPALDRPLALSYSQLDDYLSCPERYRLRYVMSIPTPPHHALAYGSAMHHAVAAFHLRRAQGAAMSEEELIGAFSAAWSPEGYLSREHEEARYAAGCESLRRFRQQQLAADPQTVAIERPFSFAVGDDQVRGRMDRVDATPDGAVVVDYKSSNVPEQAKADARARESLQLQIYALAHEAQTGELPHEVQLHFLDSGTIGRSTPDPARLAKARSRIAAAATGIRAGEFKPNPNPVACGYCPFRDICPSSAAGPA